MFSRKRGFGLWMVAVLVGVMVSLAACGETPTPGPAAAPPTQATLPPPPARPTPTPTQNPRLSPTPTPTPSPRPTSTPTPSPTPTPAVDVDRLPLLRDEAVAVPDTWVWFESGQGFRIAHPPDWLALDLTQADWEAVLQQVTDPDLRARLDEQARALIASQTAALLTASAPERSATGFPFASNLNIVSTSLPADASQDVVVQAIVQNLRQIPGLRLESLNRGQLHGAPAVAALYTYPARGTDGRAYTVVGWQVYIRTRPDRLDVLTFSTLADAFDARIQDFARMAASFERTDDQGAP